MKTFEINMVITREQNDSEFDDISKVKSEITSWLEDLDFTVEFDSKTYHEKAKDIEDFNITVRIAVYSTKGEFIKQCDSSLFSDETIKSIMDDIGKEMDNG